MTCGTMADWAFGVRARPITIKLAVRRIATIEFFFTGLKITDSSLWAPCNTDLLWSNLLWTRTLPQFALIQGFASPRS